MPEDIAQLFVMNGAIVPLRKAGLDEWTPSRPLGGWLMTYGKLGPDGSVVPTRDREGHVVEAAREIGHIDWKPYVKGGRWNDTHDEDTVIGMPTVLQFHEPESDMAKAHGKMGFWTEGHLFDRRDPRSWEGLTDTAGAPRMPTELELRKADHFWNLANLLKGTPRPIGLSAHGKMMVTPDGRIVWARVDHAAVCELPMNPDATLEVLAKGMAGVPLHEVLAKSVNAGTMSAIVPEDLEGVDAHQAAGAGIDSDKLIEHLMERYFLSRPEAVRWIKKFLTRHGVKA